MPEHVLVGCRPAPLADYLKALAVLRLVSVQADPEATGHWDGLHFCLRSSVHDLVSFFADEYAPSPIVTPWNGGSGFFPKDRKTGIDAIWASTTPRFQPFRSTIAACRSVLHRQGLTDKPSADDKVGLVEALRSELPDEALDWLDAALALTRDGLSFPPLLGTGGNDGRLDFANNQMQRLAEVLIDGDGARPLLAASLLGQPAPGRQKSAVGQFDPLAGGGANSSTGFDDAPRVNPWDFILTLEGSLVLAGAVSRKFEVDKGSLVYPFTVRPSSAGYASDCIGDDDTSRAEMWLPLWSRPAQFAEVRALFGEGRARVGGRNVRNGLDFAKSVATLGTARGVDSFSRFGFQRRNGLSYFASPLGIMRVPDAPRETAALLGADGLDAWLDGFRRFAASKEAPAWVSSARLELERAEFDVCRHGARDHNRTFLVRLARLEMRLARSPAARNRLRPVPRLSLRWLQHVAGNDPESHLARSLAASGLRQRAVPVRPDGARRLIWSGDTTGVVVTGRDLVSDLVAVLARREVEQSQADPDVSVAARPTVGASVSDIAAFIEGRLDVELLADLALAFSLLDWSKQAATRAGSPYPGAPWPSAVFALLALAHHRVAPHPADTLQRTPGLIGLGRARRVGDAAALAAQRLRSAGYVLRCDRALPPTNPDEARRTVAALAFPLDDAARATLRHRITTWTPPQGETRP